MRLSPRRYLRSAVMALCAGAASISNAATSSSERQTAGQSDVAAQPRKLEPLPVRVNIKSQVQATADSMQAAAEAARRDQDPLLNGTPGAQVAAGGDSLASTKR
jgi:hypothetical protein